MSAMYPIQLLDREAPIEVPIDDTSLEETVLYIARNHLNILPVSINLFAFKKGDRWFSPDMTVRTLAEEAGAGKLQLPTQLRIRFKLPVWKSKSFQSLRHIDPVAFRYYYEQVRKDFDNGKVCVRKQGCEKQEKWWSGFLQTTPKDRSRNKEIETLGNVMDLVSRNMAIDVVAGVKDKKEVLSSIKPYMPRDLWSGPEKLMAVRLLHTKMEACVDRLLKAFKATIGPNAMIEDFLRLTDRFFPNYFNEEFLAEWEEGGGRTLEVTLVISPPRGDEEVEIVIARRVEKGTQYETVAKLSQICNIAYKADEGNLEISRMNGIPLYFRLPSPMDTLSLLSLLCGYYRLTEKWTFSLCTELNYPLLEKNLANKVHGPISKEFAMQKMKKLKLKKGLYLLHQCPQTHGKVQLLYCSKDGCRPDELTILNSVPGEYHLEQSPILQIPEHIYRAKYPSISSLINDLKMDSCSLELVDCVHPSEFDRCKMLLLCRTPAQWKADALGSKGNNNVDKSVISCGNLSRYEAIVHQGRMCRVWKGEWRRSTTERTTVAIKQLETHLMPDKMREFFNLASRCMLWEDGSLVSVFGCTLPLEDEPPILVREYFTLGPLDEYLRQNKSVIQPVDLMVAATSVARAIFHLEDKGIIHGEIRCRNVYVAQHEDNLFKVKLCEGSLGGPRPDDIHWLDFEQIMDVLNSGVLSHAHHSGLSQGSAHMEPNHADVFHSGELSEAHFHQTDGAASTVNQLVDGAADFGVFQYRNQGGSIVQSEATFPFVQDNFAGGGAASGFLHRDSLTSGGGRSSSAGFQPENYTTAALGRLGGGGFTSNSSNTPVASCNMSFDQMKIKTSLEGDVWSYATTLWEIFSYGEKPLPEMSALEAAQHYKDGHRLAWPGIPQLAQVYQVMKDCWLPLPGQRKKAQAILRDMNQLLYKVFNSRRVHEYVTIDTGYSVTTAILSPPSSPVGSGGSSSDSVSTLKSDSINVFHDSKGLVPIFKELTRNLMEENGGRLRRNCGDSDSTSPLINSASSSSSLFASNMSGLTYQTSLDYGGAYSISSIYQLDDSQIEYNTEFPIGEGNFGIVYKGVRTKSDGDWEQVAVKMIKDTDTLSHQAVDDMEREVSLMKRLSHDNIVKIRGVSSIGNHTIIVMEYIREGSLDRYLHVNRHTLDYPRQLFGYAQNIADGMEYLTHHKIIHRDLAARNILVADQETVKISDFGLARVATNDFYVMQSTTNIPVKWLALESLLQSKYSHASDVWAFGVTLWEMFAFGKTPALPGCENFFHHGESYEKHRQDLKDWVTMLEQGMRLPRTEYCPNYLYSRVMLACWTSDPLMRPSFTQLKQMLRQAELEVT